ncbi:hypothetical protein E2977_04480 (plasmid) [Paracoccus yeei]
MIGWRDPSPRRVRTRHGRKVGVSDRRGVGDTDFEVQGGDSVLGSSACSSLNRCEPSLPNSIPARGVIKATLRGLTRPIEDPAERPKITLAKQGHPHAPGLPESRALKDEPYDEAKIHPAYPAELRERGVRLFRENRGDYASDSAAYKAIAPKLGCSPDSLRVWCQQAERDRGERGGLTSAEKDRIKELEREVRELRTANEILKKASAYFAAAELVL